MTEPNVNIPLLRKAVEWAEAEAAKPYELREWDQGAYRVLPEEFEDEYGLAGMKSPECGTCYCIAGYVAEQQYGHLPNPIDAAEIAERELRLSGNQLYRLFDGNNTIEDVRRIAESIAGERL